MPAHDAPECAASLSHEDERVLRLVAARLHAPFEVLGAHREGSGWVLRVWRPGASALELVVDGRARPARCVHAAGLFELRVAERPRRPWRLGSGGHDAYAFPPCASAHDLHLFGEGRLHQAWRLLGAHVETVDEVPGVRFRVWAPGAERVSVVGDFNAWDGRVHPLQTLGVSGVWELFVPDLDAGTLYKFELRERATGHVFLREDPYARASELRPASSSCVVAPSAHRWCDGDWLARRARTNWLQAPLNVYELHAGSWMRHADGRFYGYRELAERLVPYVLDVGYTHVEFLPLTEHPLDESWGYQTTGFFAPTSRYGTPEDLRALIDALHGAGIGCLLDWVPGHFPANDGALAHYDGSALYEHGDPRRGRHPDWGTHIFNYGRNEVCSFLLSSAHYWLEEFHFDGLRVDAVASMLYLDYSRQAGEWLPNRYGGRENLEAIAFLRELNVMVHGCFAGAVTIAEESTAWPQVSRPVEAGGLGFTFKWNMGWMNDTLRYFHLDPIHRRHHHDWLTFGQLYAYSENFLLPLSHDEVVHGKGSLPQKMPGDDWQRYANLRLLFLLQMTTPGKKLNFMGNEFGQSCEWRCDRELEWREAANGLPAGLRRLLRDLNRLYRETPALHERDHATEGFRWIDCDDALNSTLAYLRLARDGSPLVVLLNFTPVPRPGRRYGVPGRGDYAVVLNSDSRHYGGTDVGGARVTAQAVPAHGLPASILVDLPPLGGLLLQPVP
ncbi:MAG TPA: 1,4-alpha-glucan branching protein GlgB [Gammaproteobacteria bacterium]|nr:1,4-alpha-glucan branching protein GlgB [Gammaproteobacteria bacterium]